MASSVRVQRNDPAFPVEVVLDGESRVVKHGDVVKVSPECAGRAPGWRAVKFHLDDTKARVYDDDVKFLQVRRDDDGNVTEVYDLGEGLLAQSTWRLATDDSPKVV
jgi:hypothetical protein